jgi:hypothetical protein
MKNDLPRAAKLKERKNFKHFNYYRVRQKFAPTAK